MKKKRMILFLCHYYSHIASFPSSTASRQITSPSRCPRRPFPGTGLRFYCAGAQKQPYGARDTQMLPSVPREARFGHEKNRLPKRNAVFLYARSVFLYGVLSESEKIYLSFGPAFTSFLPAALPSYLWKFLMKRDARSSAFLFHSSGSA